LCLLKTHATNALECLPFRVEKSRQFVVSTSRFIDSFCKATLIGFNHAFGLAKMLLLLFKKVLFFLELTFLLVQFVP